ncbi:MAG: cyclodeaminase/cyclohydrolase family protein [Clostridiales bacterium]|nr:cyclodeaminase/cyclohydrolase family protein [Clostridiales bacterium]MCD8134349.1 cyclodeaminase/cyclohydrolase family protein [Clostridiales bacterium]
MSFKEYTLDDFTQALASKEAVPGGGGAGALVAAVGIALGNMVGSLTVGKKTYADVEDEMRVWMKQASVLREELLCGMDADAEAFLPLSKAYGIPKNDPSRPAVMEEALRKACDAPLALMSQICQAIELLEGFAAKGSRIAVSDAGVGAVCCKAALQGASLNVFINTKSMRDRKYAAELERRADDLLEEYMIRADRVYESVLEKIRPA